MSMYNGIAVQRPSRSLASCFNAVSEPAGADLEATVNSHSILQKLGAVPSDLTPVNLRASRAVARGV